jgi:hypothetical protein
MNRISLKSVLVTSTQYRKLVHAGAVCSRCHMDVATHGGYVPCDGGEADISQINGSTIFKGCLTPKVGVG